MNIFTEVLVPLCLHSAESLRANKVENHIENFKIFALGGHGLHQKQSRCLSAEL